MNLFFSFSSGGHVLSTAIIPFVFHPYIRGLAVAPLSSTSSVSVGVLHAPGYPPYPLQSNTYQSEMTVECGVVNKWEKNIFVHSTHLVKILKGMVDSQNLEIWKILVSEPRPDPRMDGSALWMPISTIFNRHGAGRLVIAGSRTTMND